jgi:hypothetical protein
MGIDREWIIDDIVSTWWELEEGYTEEDEETDRDTLSEYSDDQLNSEHEIAKQRYNEEKR